ncbi:heme/hemin ABC transporter substrate-binding protein [Gloeobacter morelensis]|uniref:Hemin ABC transporter substrate-binding protein n=1 Tax=Gloeobacter morelensis MG652769 TaxID=2781736 RepID=A0ABY3PIF0_9CYAN|nr:hemin ABC transporter substrate-binding protein [Gloeobacter morelensis]UFP93422.1 hemin ABC transporter substrate-binding protein [Gloeobacter morelensis MG652769]
MGKMPTWKGLGFALLALLAMVCAGRAAEKPSASRLVALGGSITEIVYALDAGAQLVGVDTSSTYPAAAARLPQVGYQRQVSAEGVLSLKPTLILATEEAGPPAALDQLKAAGVKLVVVPSSEHTPAGVEAKIRAVAKAVGRTERGEALVAGLRKDLAAARGEVAQQRVRPRVLFLYARGANTLMVAGRDNAAAAMLTLAGATNAVDGYEGYKPLTAEAAVAAAPDVVLVPTAGLASVGGIDGLAQLPGLALTPALKNKRVVAMDDLYLLGFGPRLAQAVRDLSRQLRSPAPAGAKV